VKEFSTFQGPVTLAHGAGGRLSHRLVADFAQIFNNPLLAPLADAALLNLAAGRFAFTTDSHVISPIFFPGGDIGRLSIFGTVNDLAVMGARPLYLSCGLIIEEGFSRDDLQRVVRSMAQAADEAGVKVVTGDTKVVECGKGDGIFINTAGIGLITAGEDLCGEAPEPGDQVLITGTLGDHAVAIINAREGLRFEADIASDCAPLSNLLMPLLKICRGVKWMRDPTRGGPAAILNEFVMNRPFGIELEESTLPIKPAVRSICELLGFDPLHLANEGKAVMVVRGKDCDKALALLRGNELGRDAAVVGRIVAKPSGRVVMKTLIGGLRVIDLPAGDLLPRIC
jgi:hydrogenase expression/formation protein HypE